MFLRVLCRSFCRWLSAVGEKMHCRVVVAVVRRVVFGSSFCRWLSVYISSRTALWSISRAEGVAPQRPALCATPKKSHTHTLTHTHTHTHWRVLACDADRVVTHTAAAACCCVEKMSLCFSSVKPVILGSATRTTHSRSCSVASSQPQHAIDCGAAVVLMGRDNVGMDAPFLELDAHTAIKTRCIHPDRPVSKACADCPRRKK